MKRSNAVSLTGSCSSCGWYDDWCFGNSCGSWNGCGCQSGCGMQGCQNGCGCTGGCLNGCGAQGCQNGCGCMGCQNGCGTCGNACSSLCGAASWDACQCQPSCSALWPDAPALMSGGVLSSRIIGSGRLCQRVNDLTLCLQDIPEEAVAPFALQSVSASGPVDWEFVSAARWRAMLRVTIPLIAQIRDCNGCTFIAHSSVTVDVPVRLTIPVSDLGRVHVAVTPGVRLLCVAACSDDGCFTVSLAVLVDVYLARWEASADGVTIPCRPDLPLTLPPSFHRGCGHHCGCC